MIHRRHRREHAAGRDSGRASRARQQAEADLEAARAELEATRAETPWFAALGARLRELRERNHLREGFEATFRGGTP